MVVNEPKWFIDAWAVFDGIAFASLRSGSVAEEIVALHPPYWTPVPVSSLAVGWGATRRSFQEGFFTADGDEIAFDDLDDIIEIVRRGYLAGGIDPGTTSEPALNPPRMPEGDLPRADSTVGERFTRAYLHGDLHAIRELFLKELAAHEKAVVTTFRDVLETTFSSAHERGDAVLLSMLGGWARCCVAVPRLGEELWHRWPEGARTDGGAPDGFLWKVALPAAFGHIRTLGDAIMATGCSVAFMRQALNDPAWRFSLLFAHTVDVALSSPPALGVNRSFDEAVASSITGMLPRRVPIEHPASVEVETLVVKLIKEGGRAVREAARRDEDEPMALVLT